MAKRCRQCGRPLGNDEGEFCSSGCRHYFEEQNPGVLAEEAKEQKKLTGCALVIIVIILLSFIASVAS